ncbi:hypothetical protein TIFTF001_028783 [Ficus carica]|uniref:Uncharacterized protein n=1 Tax=Ficus carica TaxID=3494 RepID=A0AA88DQC9_FICCA|nr:hypothetical protein TIFTF001_028783 [Ficus carica]
MVLRRLFVEASAVFEPSLRGLAEFAFREGVEWVCVKSNISRRARVATSDLQASGARNLLAGNLLAGSEISDL